VGRDRECAETGRAIARPIDPGQRNSRSRLPWSELCVEDIGDLVAEHTEAIGEDAGSVMSAAKLSCGSRETCRFITRTGRKIGNAASQTDLIHLQAVAGDCRGEIVTNRLEAGRQKARQLCPAQFSHRH